MVQFDMGQPGNPSTEQVFHDIRTKFGYTDGSVQRIRLEQ